MRDAQRETLAAHPGFSSFQQVIPLAGFSGAAIALLRNPGGAQFVRKAAMTSEGNGALHAQASRQRWLRSRLAGAAEVPEIFDEDEVEGLYYFDMEFVPSRDANAFLATASLSDVQNFAASVEHLIRQLSECPSPTESAPTIQPLILKIAEIDTRTAGCFAALLEPLRDMIVASDFSTGTAHATVCHGDLTFENILVGAKHRLWLIDPIQSPLNHYWFDWSKLFQECEGHWYLHRRKPISTGVVHWLRNRWHRTAVELAPGYASWHYLLLALTFARILPYARTEADIGFVVGRVREFSLSAKLFL